ncbi:hypothetical protein ILYODFUR_014822, partial [Ilyodon furcidens]
SSRVLHQVLHEDLINMVSMSSSVKAESEDVGEGFDGQREKQGTTLKEEADTLDEGCHSDGAALSSFSPLDHNGIPLW